MNSELGKVFKDTPRMVSFAVVGTLPSLRGKEFNVRSATVRGRIIGRHQKDWLTKLGMLGMVGRIHELQRIATEDFKKLYIRVIIVRARKIFDYKNRVNAADRILIDALVHRGALFSDASGNISLTVDEMSPSPEMFDGQDYVMMVVAVSNERCSRATRARWLKEKKRLLEPKSFKHAPAIGKAKEE